VPLYPVSLLITAAVLAPNLLFLFFPPTGATRYDTSADSLLFTILERVGQAGSFILPVFFPLAFSGTLVRTAWVTMGALLALYYAGWTRFFTGTRDYALLFKPMLGIPVPLALGPVLYFLVSSIVLGSVWQAIAAAILGIGHVTIALNTRRRVDVKRHEATSEP
jgi:hypothetical protein